MYLLIISINQFISTQNPYFLFYSALSKFQHPSYLYMYLDWCIIALLYFLFKNIIQKYNWAFILLISFFSFYTLLLESKTGISILSLIIITSIIICFVLKKYKIAIITILTMLIGFIFYMQFVPEKSNRIALAFKSVKEQNNKQKNNTFTRFIIWENAYLILHNNWILGKGTGDVEESLEQAYKQINTSELQTAIKNNFNAHNQYLQTFIAIGIIGETILLGCLFIPLYLSIIQRNYLYLCFLLLIIINLFSESMLERQAGIVFYALFNIILFKLDRQ